MARILIPEIPVSLTSTNVDASALTEWATSTSYTTGDLRKVTDEGLPHREYKCKQNHTSSSTNKPVQGGNSYWIDEGATNQHKMFDGMNNTPTVVTDESGNIVVELALTKRLQTLSLMGMRNVSSATVVQSVDGVEVANSTIDLRSSIQRPGWWNWLFGERTYSKSIVHRLAGNYRTQDLTITLTGAPNAECAQCMVSRAIDLGPTLDDAQPRIKKWSTFKADEFGNYTFTPRKGTRTGTYTLMLDTAEVDRVYTLMEEIEERLVVLDANNDDTAFDSIIAYGSIVDFAPGIKYNKTRCDIKIEGIN